MITSAVVKSPSNDELANLPSGYVYLLRGDYIDGTHPPLLRYLVSIPLFIMGPDHFPDDPVWYKSWHSFGRKFIYKNQVSSSAIVFWPRFMVMLLTLGLGLLIYLWSRERFGRWGGLFSTTLFSLEPNMLAHGRLVTNDLAIAFAYFGAAYLFGRYLVRPGWKTLLAAAIGFALAQLTKYPAVLLVPAFLIVSGCVWWTRSKPKEKNPEKRRGPRRFWVAAGTYVGVTIILILAAYRFEFRSLSEDRQIQTARTAQVIQKKISSVAQSLGTTHENITAFRIPAYNYLKGLTLQVFHSAMQSKWHDSEFYQYALGRYSRNGWWWYFPVAFLLKTPLALLFLFLLAAVLGVISWRIRRYEGDDSVLKEDTLCLLIPPLLYFAVCLTSTINIGHRYLLPIYPFLFVMAGKITTAWPLVKNRLMPLFFSVIGLILIVPGSLHIHPHYLSYFNCLVGPQNGWRYLSDSNVDWGQDLLLLKEFLDRKSPPVVYMDVFGSVRPEDLGINYLPVPEDQPSSDEHFMVVVSVNRLLCKNVRKPSGLYPWLLDREPTRKIGYSIFIYEFEPG
ncbi:MAG: glycosyltransferase family 39 protein [Deltaproteobacteria bacterium]|nr:glycosyltransferase family 39 protein [Deltaproteobacteria bacterium]